MPQEYLRKLTQEYIQLDKNYREYLHQFFVLLMKRRGLKAKVLNCNELKKIKKMHEEVEKIYQKWLSAVRK